MNDHKQREDVMTVFGRNLKTAMDARGITVHKLRMLTNVQHIPLHGYINGTMEPRLSMAVRLAQAIDVPIAELFEGCVWKDEGEQS